MRLPDILTRINRHGGSVALLVLLFGLAAVTHWFARFRMEIASRQFAIMDDRTAREMSIIDFIHDHVWIVAAYAVLSFTSLIWLESRTSPRWAVWVTFLVLAIPLLAYGGACLHIGSKFIMWSVSK